MLNFAIRDRRCALPASAVAGVLMVRGLTPVPGAPSAVRGIVCWQGEVLPVLDIGPWLATDYQSEPARPSRLRLEDRAVAFRASPSPHLPPALAAVSIDRLCSFDWGDEAAPRSPPPALDFVSAIQNGAEGSVWILDPAAILRRVQDSIATQVHS